MDIEMTTSSQLGTPAVPPLPRSESPWADILAAGIIATLTLLLFIHGWHYRLMPFDNDWGETALAIHAAECFRNDGFRYGLLENMGTSEAPVLYTHNVNLGSLSYIVMDLAGIRSVEGKQTVTILIFACSLWFVFITVRGYTGSTSVGLLTLFFFCIEYRNVGSFGYNALRAWHWIGLFGSLHFVRALMLGGRWLARAGLLFTVAVAFGCGYDFLLIAISSAALVLLLQCPRPLLQRGNLRLARLLLIATLLPFLARQAQIIGVLGWRYWTHDLKYTVGIKVPFMAKLLRLPSMERIDAYYRDHSVLRPPAIPSESMTSVFGTASQFFETITIPSWGLITIVAFSFICAYGLALLLLDLVAWKGSERSAGGRPGRRFTDLLVCVTLGAAVGILALAPFTLHVYMKHQFPLLAAPLLIAKATAFVVLADRLRRYWRVAPAHALAAGALVAMLSVDTALAALHRHGRAHYIDLGWLEFARTNVDARLGVSMHPLRDLRRAPALAEFERCAVDPSNAEEILRAFTGQPVTNRPPLPVPADLDYLIYQPADRWSHFDAATPDSRSTDYLLELLRRRSQPRHSIRIIEAYASPQDPANPLTCHVGPRSTVFLFCRFKAPIPGLRGVRLTRARSRAFETTPHTWEAVAERDESVGIAVYNCIYHYIHAWYFVEPSDPRTPVAVDLQAELDDGSFRHVQRFTIDVRDDHATVSQPVVPVRRPQPDVDALIKMFPSVPVVERGHHGIGYVVFDLRRWRGERRAAIAREAPGGVPSPVAHLANRSAP